MDRHDKPPLHVIGDRPSTWGEDTSSFRSKRRAMESPRLHPPHFRLPAFNSLRRLSSLPSSEQEVATRSIMSPARPSLSQNHSFPFSDGAARCTSQLTGPTETDDAAGEESEDGCRGRKRQRYLRDVDRRNIILRIENGEKQAALAREFGVTRAAICHIKKNRDEIISRYDSLVKSAMELERSSAKGSPTSLDESVPPLVHQLACQTVLMLLTTLRDASTPHRAFRATADRLMMVLLEEALADVATVPCELRTTAGDVVCGVKRDPSLCCISIDQDGLPFMQLYQQIEPSGATGYVHLRRVDERRNRFLVVDRIEIPTEVTTESSILLFACTASDGLGIRAAIESLVEIGILESKIRLVVIVCTNKAISQICDHFPDVRILTCAVEASKGSTTLGDFLERYSTIHFETVRGSLDSQRPRQQQGSRTNTSSWDHSEPSFRVRQAVFADSSYSH